MTLELPDGWSLLDRDAARGFEAELARELAPSHRLRGVALEAVAARNSNDDVLFRSLADARRFVVVHLTWIGREEDNPYFPAVVFAGTFPEFLAAEEALLAELGR